MQNDKAKILCNILQQEDDDDVSTSKSGATESSEDAGAATEALNELPKVRKKKIKRERRKYAAKASELVQDADVSYFRL